MAAKAEDTTFGDILGYQYIDSGEFYKTKTSTLIYQCQIY
ncbi:hypothetical protein BSPWISOXPB_250 [uncultured Gammaproteobacteria bacterium]|nr:hypothetical protein BSPWISOXPB_250 [uncultured Gammaproteobacteria bacterium]